MSTLAWAVLVAVVALIVAPLPIALFLERRRQRRLPRAGGLDEN